MNSIDSIKQELERIDAEIAALAELSVKSKLTTEQLDRLVELTRRALAIRAKLKGLPT